MALPRSIGKHAFVFAGSLTLGVLAGWSAVGAQIDRAVYDVLVRLDPPPPGPSEAVILAIDEPSLDAFGGLLQLRERRSDIGPLAERFLSRFHGQYGREVRLDSGALRALGEHTWPGNVRQLEHLLERLVILSPATTIDATTIVDALDHLEPRKKAVRSLADAEEEQIRKVLTATGGNKTRATQILNIERKTLYRKLERMNS